MYNRIYDVILTWYDKIQTRNFEGTEFNFFVLPEDGCKAALPAKKNCQLSLKKTELRLCSMLFISIFSTFLKIIHISPKLVLLQDIVAVIFEHDKFSEI